MLKKCGLDDLCTRKFQMVGMGLKEAKLDGFETLGDEGFWAKENNGDCSRCGWDKVPENAGNVVFYHEQDALAFDSGYLSQPIYIAHRGNSKRICEVFKNHGFVVAWSGNENDRIAIMTVTMAAAYKDLSKWPKGYIEI